MGLPFFGILGVLWEIWVSSEQLFRRGSWRGRDNAAGGDGGRGRDDAAGGDGGCGDSAKLAHTATETDTDTAAAADTDTDTDAQTGSAGGCDRGMMLWLLGGES